MTLGRHLRGHARRSLVRLAQDGPELALPGGFESLRRTVLDPATNFEVVPVTATMEHFTRVPLVELADPFDRFILATAVQLGLPLVTVDRAMSRCGAVQVIQ